jgi:hypothetical protein
MSQSPETVSYSLASILNEIKKLSSDINGIGKRLENRELTNRGILIALVVASLGGAAKLFGLVGNP